MTDVKVNTSILGVVAQTVFSKPPNTFSTVWPLFQLRAGGTVAPVSLEDFPNDGRVFWLVRDEYQKLARPGTLISGDLDLAPAFMESDPRKQKYQLRLNSVAHGDSPGCVSVLDATSDPRQILRNRSWSQSVHEGECPLWTSRCLFRFEELYYGPFTVQMRSDSDGWKQQLFLTESNVDEAHAYESSVLTPLVVRAEASISRDSQFKNPTSRSLGLVSAAALKTVRSSSRLVDDPTLFPARALQSVIAALGTRKQKQRLKQLVAEVEEAADATGRVKIETAIQALEQHEAEVAPAIDALGSALLEQPRIRTDLESRVAKEWAAGAAGREQAERERLRELTRDEKAGLEKAAAETALKQADFEKVRNQLEEARAEVEQLAGAAKLLALENQRAEASAEGLLKRLQESAATVATETAFGRALLALQAPQHAAGFTNTQERLPEQTIDSRQSRKLEFPDFVTAPAGKKSPLSEDRFLSNFAAEARGRGYRFASKDLRRFHLAVKSEALTILSGPAGVGKSSLPWLYAAAANLGDRFHVIGVSPGWLDRRDILGFPNALTNEFQQSETLLFEKLVFASEEYQRKGDRSGVWLFVLDEMNLATIEHYFHDFIVALERPEGSRFITCFSPSSLHPDAELRRYSKLCIPPTVRFVGTVNTDETTKPLSLRLLDRVNLIQLSEVPDGEELKSETSIEEARQTLGLEDLNQWRGAPSDYEKAIPVLKEIEKELRSLGCGMSPRCVNGIERTLASAGRTSKNAFEVLDWQFVQRVLPQMDRRLDSGAVEGKDLDALQEKIGSDARLALSLAGIRRLARQLDFRLERS